MVNYNEYIISTQWKVVKRRYINSGLPRDCPACNKKFNRSFHFHHKTYKNLGNELLSDIVPMCCACHNAFHKWFKFQCKQGNKLSLWDATELYCSNRLANISTLSNIKISTGFAQSDNITLMLPRKKIKKFQKKFDSHGGGRKTLRRLKKLMKMQKKSKNKNK